MGMEALGADITAEQVKDRIVMVSTDAQKLEKSIQFGLVDTSNGVNGEAKEVTHAGDANFPKDAVDDWPAPKKIHSFYFVKYRSYDDPKLKVKIEQADKDVQRKRQARFQIFEALKAKRTERSQVISQLKLLNSEEKNFRTILDDKRKEMEPLQEALGKLRDASNTVREKGSGLCSSVEELNDLIRSLHYRMQHESNTLVEEKQLLKQIKQLEGTRDKVIANSAMKAEIQESLGEKAAIQDQVKLKFGDLDGVKKDKKAVREKINLLQEELNAINNEITSLEEELAAATEKKDKAYETLFELRKSRDLVNASFFQNRSLLNSAKDLAAKKDIGALEELSHGEVEKFMSQWSSSKAFRDDYERRILGSLDSRQLSKDGRMRNPDEKPILSEESAPPQPEAVPAKVNVKKAKEELKLSACHEIMSNRKDQEEDTTTSTELELGAKLGPAADIKSILGTEKPQKEASKPNVIDAAKLKEMKREEEIAKAKLALERKKKLAEKAAAKAAVRAQKEAEKKLKEKEKRAKKKAGASEDPPAADNEIDSEVVAEQEEADLSTEAPAVEKNQKQKDNVVRNRNYRPKAKEQIPKMIIKRKKSHSYWMWAASAIVLALVLAVYGIYSFR